MEDGTIDYYADTWGAGRITPDRDKNTWVTFLESAIRPAGARARGRKRCRFRRSAKSPTEAVRVEVL